MRRLAIVLVLAMPLRGQIGAAAPQGPPGIQGPPGPQGPSGNGNTSASYMWQASPSSPSTLSAGILATVNLPACPAGVFGVWPGPSYQASIASGANSRYFVHIGGASVEDVKVTGGTCNGDGLAGTLQFTPANPHAAGYTLLSSTAGIQEASVAAAVTIVSGGAGTFPYTQQDGVVIVEAGDHVLTAPLSFLANNQTIYFYGSVRCNFDDDCIRVGHDAQYQTPGLNVTLVHPQIIPGINNGTHDAIVVFGNHTTLINVSAFQPALIGGTPRFGHIVTDYGDQAMNLDGLSNADVIRCDATFCGSRVYAPGPFSGHAGTPYTGGDNSAVGFISHIQIGNCNGNGVDWQSGNTLRISDSVLQGYSQFAVRFSMAKGGFGSLQMDNVYNEAGCSNPLNAALGTAGLIVIGGRAFLTGGESPNGSVPIFASQGGTNNFYYVVATDGVTGSSNLLYAGIANLNNTGSVNVVFNQIPGATAYDLLASTTLYQAPFGTGNWAVATAQSAGTICSGGVCTIIDTQAARGSYTVAATVYAPQIPLWFGNAVLSNSAIVNSPSSTAQLTLNYNDFNFVKLTQVNTAGSTTPVITSTRCILTDGSPIWQSCIGNEQDQAATVLAGGSTNGQKGRLNLMGFGGTSGHFITLFDANLKKTIASALGRPTYDSNDTYIGYDAGGGQGAPQNIGLAIGAPVSITEYIGSNPDGTNLKERLTSTTKSIKVPLDIAGGSVNKAVCFKADGKTLGFCSTVVASDGSCTCN